MTEDSHSSPTIVLEAAPGSRSVCTSGVPGPAHLITGVRHDQIWRD